MKKSVIVVAILLVGLCAAIWMYWPEKTPEVTPIAGPKETAELFFKALAANDAGALKPLAGDSSQILLQYYGGLEVISIGKPYQKPGQYAGWLVPYEIRLKSGELKEFNLAVRNDNPNRQWTIDGGI